MPLSRAALKCLLFILLAAGGGQAVAAGDAANYSTHVTAAPVMTFLS